MKGLVFVEYLDFLETRFGEKTADRVIVDSRLPNNGSFSKVGSYPFESMVNLLLMTQKHTEVSISVILQDFGKLLFHRFSHLYPAFFTDLTNGFDFLQNIETFIHPEVYKLYPDAELPTFETLHTSKNKLVLVYQSNRKLHDFAQGLIAGCMEYFKEEAVITKQMINRDESIVEFTIKKGT